MSAHEAMILVVALCLSGCMLEAEYSPPQFADEGFIEPDAPPGQLAPTLPAEPARVSFDDWACPEGWSPAPAMVDGAGQVLEIEGVEPFDVCLPPQLPEGSAAQLQMKDWDCPQGWNAVPGMADEDGAPLPRDGIEPFTVCQPPDLPEDCPEGFISQIGSAQCVRLGRPCPDEGERWRDEEAIKARAEGFEGQVLYVLPAAQDGTGGREQPFGSLEEAVAQAGPGDIVALGTGQHDVGPTISNAIALVGACAAQTHLVSQTPHDTEATLGLLSVERAFVSDLTISGPRVGLRVLDAQGPVTLRGLEVSEARGTGISVESGVGEVVFESLVVNSTQPYTADDSGGVGLEVIGGARVVVRNAVLSQNHSAGIKAAGANTDLNLEGVIVRDTQPQPSDLVGGYGVWVSTGAIAEARQLALIENHHHGLRTEGTGTSILVEDALIADTQPAAFDETEGQGVFIARTAQAELRRLVVARSHFSGVHITDEGTRATLEDLVIHDTQPRAAGLTNGNGLRVENSASASASRVVALRNHTSGVVCRRQSFLSFEDLIVHDTFLQLSVQSSGQGLGVREGGRVEGKRLSAIRNHHFSIIVADGSVVVLEDVISHGTRSVPSGVGGYGLRVQSGGDLTLRRATLSQNSLTGIWLATNTRTVLEDVVVQDNTPSPRLSNGDGGLVAQSHLEATRLLLRDNFHKGFGSSGDADVTLRQALIRGTHLQGQSPENGGGARLAGKARVSMGETLILGNEAYGVQVKEEASLTLDNTLIAHTQPYAVDGMLGAGVLVEERGHVEATRLRLDHNHSAGLLAHGISASISLEDLIVTQTQPRGSDRVLGRGLELKDGARMVLRRATFTGNHDRSVVLGTLTSSTLEDVTIAETQLRASDSLQGRGLEMLPQSVATMSRVALINNYEVALGLFSADATIEDLFIASTWRQSCSPNCVPLFGTGIVMVGGSLTLADFEIMGSALAGLHLVNPGSFFAQRGVVRSNEIGLNFQGGPDPDLSELFEEVEFFKNGQNYGSEDLIVPAEPAPQGG